MDLSTHTPGVTHLDAAEDSSNPPAATPQTPLLDSLSKRTSSTPYRKEWNKITGSVHASIFLEQLIWLWRKAGRKAFAKFVSPCSHPDYRPGSSWHEELGFSRREFEGAARVLGTKITAGVSLREERKRNILVYWTDKSRRTHWELNAALLEARLRDITEDSDALACTLLMKCTDRTFHKKSTTSAVHKDAPTPAPDSANSRGKSNGRQPYKTHDLETPVLEDALDESRSSLSSSPETRDSEGRRSSREVTTLPGAGESSKTNSKSLKSQEQKPSPRQSKRGSVSSSASSAKALAVKAAELSPAARETLEAALGRQTELKGQANVPHTRRRLLALLGADETAWIALLSHSTLTARTCVASFAETHAKRPACAGKSLADAAKASKREIDRSGSFARDFQMTEG